MRDIRADHARYLAWLADEFHADAGALDAEYEAGTFRRDFLARLGGLHAALGPQRIGTSDAWCLRALYLLVRAARPRIVVETGVLYGASSAHLLAALDRNGQGELFSIDLAHAAGEPPADYLVPDGLADRWTLVEGDSRLEVPRLLPQLGPVDLFHHDSLHTFEHMTWEYETALPHLARGGVLSSHDVLWGHSLRRIFRRKAFRLFCEQHALRWQIFQNNGFARRGEPDGA